MTTWRDVSVTDSDEDLTRTTEWQRWMAVPRSWTEKQTDRQTRSWRVSLLSLPLREGNGGGDRQRSGSSKNVSGR